MSENEQTPNDPESTPVPNNDASPAPPTADPETSAADGSESETPKPPPYAGEWKPNPNAQEPLPVTEGLTPEELKHLAKNGSVLLSNLEYDELNAVSDQLRAQLASKQAERHEMVKQGIGGAYVPLKLPSATLYVTEDERQVLMLIREYFDTLRQGAGHDLFDEGDTWTNLPSRGDAKIAISRVDQSKNKDPILQIRHKLGLSTEHHVPLWSSGMHLTIAGTGALEQLTLDTRLLIEKIDYGRESSGYVYSASSVFLNREVANFMLKQVRYSTVGYTDPERLKKLILLTDLEPLVLGGASTLWPDGYLLERPCLTSEGGCGYVIQRKVNLRRMLFVADSKVTKDQFQLMTKRSGKVDEETVRAYQAQMRPEISRMVPLSNGVTVKLCVPTLAEYERVAGAWMLRMDQRAKDLVASNASEQERQIYLGRATSVALLMAYGHWIEAILQDGENLDDERTVVLSRKGDYSDEEQYKVDKKLDDLLEDMSGDNEITNKIVPAIEKFISAMTIATPCVPKARCPGCGQPVTGDNLSTHPHLVNINPIEVFFTLLRHKIRQAGG